MFRRRVKLNPVRWGLSYRAMRVGRGEQGFPCCSAEGVHSVPRQLKGSVRTSILNQHLLLKVRTGKASESYEWTRFYVTSEHTCY